MEYYDTWFSKQSMTYHSGSQRGRHHWMYHFVDVFTGGFTPMHRVNDDGSIDVLGANILRMSSGMTMGTYDKKAMQHSLAEHAKKLKEAGATIVKQTRNTLVARHGRETAYFFISHLNSRSFYKNLNV